MLVLSKVRAGGHLYFLAPTGRTGGPAREPPGWWAGRGAAATGLRGPVEATPLEALLAGADPRTGSALGADRRRVTVAAYDLTFCAPKSVSILHGLADPEVRRAVQGAHDRAVTAALGYVEDHALAVRRGTGAGGRAVLPAEPAPAAAFLHRTSRADDPHLHSHVLVANLGRGPAGDVSALDGRGVYAHRAATAALYHAQLRHDLSRTLGVAWEPLDRGRAEIAGVGAELRRAFSRRSAAIAAHLAGRGLTGASPQAARVASFATRPEKNLEVPMEELRREWHRRARDLGLGPTRVAGLLDRAPACAREGAPVAADVVAASLASARGGAGTFTRRDVVRAWAGASPSGAPAAEVERAADAFMVRIGRGGPDGPGVAEARHALPDDLGLVASPTRRGEQIEDRRQVERLLERRGVSLAVDRSPGRALELGGGLGW